MSRLFWLAGTASGLISVALGAFAAHGLKERLDPYHLEVFRTAVFYQFLHALALLPMALWLRHADSGLVRACGICFIVGTVIFSGSLYALALTGTRAWGAVTPIGGVAFMAGWVCAFGAGL